MQRTFRGSLLLALSTVIVCAYLCLPAEAQTSQKTNAANVEGKGTARDFRFEVVSIRPIGPEQTSYGGGPLPNGYRVKLGLYDLIKLAYSLHDGLPADIGIRVGSTNVVNAPNWGVYQIDARVAENDIPAWQAQGKDQELLRSAMRAVLEDRFRLKLHKQQTEIPVYDLVVSRKGIQFKPSTPGSVVPLGYKFPDGGVSPLFSRDDPNQPARFYNATITDLIRMMEGSMDRPIHDSTELTGRYDFSVYRVRDADPSDRYLLSKLGLDLKQGKGTGLNLIVDHVEKPSPN